jgi:hypothetical protein
VTSQSSSLPGCPVLSWLNPSLKDSYLLQIVESTSTEEAEKALQKCDAGGVPDASVTIGELTLVDLSGSDRANKTGAEEGANINKSLLTLGLVIKNLSESAAQGGALQTQQVYPACPCHDMHPT